MIIQGWTRKYHITPRDAERYTSAILSELTDKYSTDDGATTFEGQAISHLISQLRRIHRFRLPGNETDCRKVFEALGFRVVKARGQRLYRGGKIGFGGKCTCITV